MGKIIDLVVSNVIPNTEAVIIQKYTSIIIEDAASQKLKDINLNKLYKKLCSEIENLKMKINEINENIINLKKNPQKE